MKTSLARTFFIGEIYLSLVNISKTVLLILKKILSKFEFVDVLGCYYWWYLLLRLCSTRVLFAIICQIILRDRVHVVCSTHEFDTCAAQECNTYIYFVDSDKRTHAQKYMLMGVVVCNVWILTRWLHNDVCQFVKLEYVKPEPWGLLTIVPNCPS